MNGTEFEWAQQESGWVDDLNAYLNNPALTDLAWYDRKISSPPTGPRSRGMVSTASARTARASRTPSRLTQSRLMLICNKDKLTKGGLQGPPKTWTEWADAAKPR